MSFSWFRCVNSSKIYHTRWLMRTWRQWMFAFLHLFIYYIRIYYNVCKLIKIGLGYKKQIGEWSEARQKTGNQTKDRYFISAKDRYFISDDSKYQTGMEGINHLKSINIVIDDLLNQKRGVIYFVYSVHWGIPNVYYYRLDYLIIVYTLTIHT
jgi:hypothetical protein